MLPRINGKEIIDCDLSDLQSIIDNPSFAENEYLDYKKAFAVDIAPKEQKAKEQVEFRNDVCSFANAQGGYLIYGIEEKKGIPTQIIGITFKGNNRDVFERDIRNCLQPIKPRVPYYRIKFVDLPEDKFVVILYIQHDYFAPYIHIEEQSNYKIYKRIGNSKSYIEYQELRAMFTQSLSLEREVERFRKERISYFWNQEDDENSTYSQFLLLHIIPDTFLDANYNKPVFAMHQAGRYISIAFSAFDCHSRPYPTPDGFRYLDREDGGKAECRLYNSGITEYFCPLRERSFLYDRKGSSHIYTDDLWNKIYEAVDKYIKIINQVIEAKRVFVCISIIGCKDAITSESNYLDITCRIDRNQLICEPVVFENIENRNIDDLEIARLHLTYLSSLGVNNDPVLKGLIKEVFGDVDAQIKVTL